MPRHTLSLDTWGERYAPGIAGDEGKTGDPGCDAMTTGATADVLGVTGEVAGKLEWGRVVASVSARMEIGFVFPFASVFVVKSRKITLSMFRLECPTLWMWRNSIPR